MISIKVAKKRPRKSAADDDEDYNDDVDGIRHDDHDIRADDMKIGGKRGKKVPIPSKGKTKKGSFGGRDSYDKDEEASVFYDCSSLVSLKQDHHLRPIWITPSAKDNKIYLEAFHPLYQEAYDRLVAVAEPLARPKFIHTYQLTENSLYAAVALGINTESIIKVLNRLCKSEIPQEVVTFIKESTSTFGKAKLVLKNNKFFIESQYIEVLRKLYNHPRINQARVQEDNGPEIATTADSTGNNGTSSSNDGEFQESVMPEGETMNNDLFHRLNALDEDDKNNDDDDDIEAALFNGEDGRINRSRRVNRSFMIDQKYVQIVKKCALEECKYPLIEEYDFRADTRNPVLQIDLRPTTKIRPYQEKSLSKMFGNGRARSGIIVLPCGAGKSLTGVTAVSTIKRSTIVLCINNASVKQWKEQFLQWTNVSDDSVKLFTSGDKNKLPESLNEACIVISTYSMMCHSGKRSESGEMMIQSVARREWGLMVLDEVHVAPADMFQKVLQLVNAHCKLGLTATLVREDDKIKDLHFLVGPKLYEANWIDLTDQGFLARVQCSEVWCPMTKEFYAEYINSCDTMNGRLQRLLYALNPRKLRTCEYLIEYHAKRYDKIIIFSDDVPALILYCEGLKIIRHQNDTKGERSTYAKIPYLYGASSEEERRKVLNDFKTKHDCCCIGLSKVGDTALDIPEANVIIQVSGQYGSRRQQAQRLGRILRPKPNPTGGFNAFFYTLISTDTREVYFSTKRQQYLIDQGYTFRVRQDLADLAEASISTTGRSLATKEQELDLLNKLLNFDVDAWDKTEDKAISRFTVGESDDLADDLLGGNAPVTTTRKSSALSSLSGVS